MNLVWIWLMAALVGLVSAGLCPGGSLHCSCRTDRGDLHVHCLRTSSVDLLKENLKTFRGRQLKSLDINQIVDRVIPYDLFQGLRVEKILMRNCRFERFETVFGRNPFSSLSDSLEHLILRDNAIDVPPQLYLDDMKELEDLAFIGVGINSVDNNWFLRGPPKLRSLIVSRANITSLGSEAFKHLEHLTSLNLVKNSISEISHGMFPPSLKTLFIGLNRLQEIDEDFFDHLPNLDFVDFSKNFLRHFPYDSFTSRNRTEIAILRENPLVCDTRLCSLVETQSHYKFDGRCAAPEDLKGMLLKDLKASQVCPDEDLF